MGLVADGAAFPQSFMLENKGPRLFAMAFSASLVLPRHGSPCAGFMMSMPWGSWHWAQFILPSSTG